MMTDLDVDAKRVCRLNRWSLSAIAREVAINTDLTYSDAMDALCSAVFECVRAMLREGER